MPAAAVGQPLAFENLLQRLLCGLCTARRALLKPMRSVRRRTCCLLGGWPDDCPVPQWRLVTMRVPGVERLPLQHGNRSGRGVVSIQTSTSASRSRPPPLSGSLGRPAGGQAFLPGACRACADHGGLPRRGRGHAACRRQQSVDGGAAWGGGGRRPAVGASHHGIAIASHGEAFWWSVWCCRQGVKWQGAGVRREPSGPRREAAPCIQQGLRGCQRALEGRIFAVGRPGGAVAGLRTEGEARLVVWQSRLLAPCCRLRVPSLKICAGAAKVGKTGGERPQELQAHSVMLSRSAAAQPSLGSFHSLVKPLESV